MSAEQDASFYTYLHSGIETLAPSRDGTIDSYIHAGLGALTPSRDGTTDTYLHAGIEMAMAVSRDDVINTYLHAGIESAPLTVVVRQPRGWGVIPTGPQQVSYITSQTDGTYYTYENVI